MGMNYYVVKNKPSIQEPIHIGKSSYGWLFCFQYQNESWRDVPVVWNTFDQVKEWLKKYTVEQTIYAIVNEEDEVVSYDEFIDLVESKQNDEFCKSNPDNFKYSQNINGYRFMHGYFS